MSRTSMPTRVISVLLAFVLTCTMLPATSLAHATEANDATVTADASSAAIDDAADASSAAESDQASEGADASDQANSASEATADEGAPAADANAVPVVTSEEKAVSQAPQAEDMLHMNVALNGTNTVLTSGNLTYTMNDDNQTVTLTGWTGTAPKGTLNIPAQVSIGNTAYQVTNIGSHENLGGGRRL